MEKEKKRCQSHGAYSYPLVTVCSELENEILFIRGQWSTKSQSDLGEK